MTDHPREALRRKKDSSMRRALDLVKAHEAHACVSAGNTGALMAMAHFVLKMLPGRRAARHRLADPLARRAIPTCSISVRTRPARPSSCASSQSWARCWRRISRARTRRPRVGLLNIGEEEIKGNETVQSRA